MAYRVELAESADRRKGTLSEDELHGLGEDKLTLICGIAAF